MTETIQLPNQAIQEFDPDSIENKPQAILQCASQIFRGTPDWVGFYREVLGVEGIVRKMYPKLEDQLAFEQTQEYTQIQQMLAQLRERKDEGADENEPTRVITVRLPKSLHESLKTEAHDRRTSMNKLCISKLLQMIDNSLVPSD